jgi:hypothetical protein
VTDFERQVRLALEERFALMGVAYVGRDDDLRRWTYTDFATDLAPCVVAAIEAAAQAVNRTLREGQAYEKEYGGVAYIGHGILEHAALSALRAQ